MVWVSSNECRLVSFICKDTERRAVRWQPGPAGEADGSDCRQDVVPQHLSIVAFHSKWKLALKSPFPAGCCLDSSSSVWGFHCRKGREQRTMYVYKISICTYMFLLASKMPAVLWHSRCSRPFYSVLRLAGVSEALQLQGSQDVKRLLSLQFVLLAEASSVCILRQKWCCWKPWPQ